MTRIAVLGVASSVFGDHRDTPMRTLGARVVAEAVRNSNLDHRRIDCAYVGYAISGLLDGQEGMVGQLILREAGITGIPITRVENACASSSCAVREAALAIRAGEARVALALGVEKMVGYETSVVMDALAGDGDLDLEGGMGMTFPGVFAMIAREHMHRYGTPRSALAAVAVKARLNGSKNPHAHFREPITMDTALTGRLIADPLTLYDCCPISDGAAAVILANEEVAKAWPGRKVWLDACVMATGSYEGGDLTAFEATRRASGLAYEISGVSPTDIDLAEVHDCFTIAEIIHTEDLGFFEKGDGGFAVLRGDTMIGGRIPINASGGLNAKGHPVGATGAGQIVEVARQLWGKAGDRQVEGAKVGLCHCMGGFFAGDSGAIVVSVLTR